MNVFHLVTDTSVFFILVLKILSRQVKRRNSEESSTQWTTGIAEVQLPIEYGFSHIHCGGLVFVPLINC